MTIRETLETLIAEGGRTDRQILTETVRRHPGCLTTVQSVTKVRSRMKAMGMKPPAAIRAVA